MGELITIERPDGTGLARESHTIVERAKSFAIVKPDDCTDAASFMRDCKTLQGRIVAHHAPAKAAAHAAHKAICAAESSLLEPLTEAHAIIAGKLAVFRQREEASRKAQEEALRNARRQQEEEARLAAAVALENAGQSKAADAVLAAPIVTPAVILPTMMPKLDGVAFTERWTYRIVNINAIPAAYMLPNDKAIGKLAESLRGAAVLPGVEFFAVTGTSTRRYK